MSISKPKLLLISLDPVHAELFTASDAYPRLLSTLSAYATVAHARTSDDALRGLAISPPHVVLVSDHGITFAKHKMVQAALLNYVRVGGGRLVLMGDFASSIRPTDMDRFFRKAGLVWTRSDYFRTTVFLGEMAQMRLKSSGSRASLPASYSQKAVFLANVNPRNAWYTPTEESKGEGLMNWGQGIDNSVAAVAQIEMGNGKIGYVGDVNHELGTDEVVLAMCEFGS